MKKTLVLLFILFFQNCYCQNYVFYNDYRSYKNIINGVYIQKSTSNIFSDIDLPIIQSDSIIDLKLDFIKIEDKPIILFDSHDITNNKPIGKIVKTTQVEIDSTFFKEIYNDFSKPWSVTYNVWNRILINNKPYYTDFDIHDFGILKKIKELNQKVLIIGQDTGYDYAYHLGYPEYFFLIFLNENNKIIYESEILKINIGDEYAMEEDILRTKWIESTKEFEITLFGRQNCNQKTELILIWNGSEIKTK